VQKAKSDLRVPQGDTKPLAEKAWTVVQKAKDAYPAVLSPYQQACLRVGVKCEYEGNHSANVSEKVSFLVEKTDKSMCRLTPNTSATADSFFPRWNIRAALRRRSRRIFRCLLSLLSPPIAAMYNTSNFLSSAS
jgi:hypothetical protein